MHTISSSAIAETFAFRVPISSVAKSRSELPIAVRIADSVNQWWKLLVDRIITQS